MVKRIGLYGGPGSGRQLVVEWDCYLYLVPFVQPIVFGDYSPQSVLDNYTPVVTYRPALFNGNDWDATRWWRPVEDRAYREWQRLEEEKRSRWSS